MFFPCLDIKYNGAFIYMKTVVHVFGNSNAESYGDEETGYDDLFVKNYWRSGASISGLNNENSELKYGDYIDKIIRNLQNTDTENNIILLHFGEVDLQFNYFYKLWNKKEDGDVNLFLTHIFNEYIKFINRIKKYGFKIIVSSTHLSNFNDDDNFAIEHIKNINNFVGDVEFNNIIQFINNNTFLLNKYLKNIPDVYFLDTTNYFIDKETKKLKLKFLSKDHHYKNWNRKFNIGEFKYNKCCDVIRIKQNYLYVMVNNIVSI